MTDTDSWRGAHLPRFDWSISFGHLLTLASFIGAMFMAYTSIQVKISEIDGRTADYAIIRDLTRSNSIQIDSLRPLIVANTEATREILRTMADMREDLAAIRAKIDDDVRGPPR